MRKLLSGVISLIIFMSVGATGAGFYLNSKSKEFVDQSIEMLKADGFNLSTYDSFEIDYFNQSIRLKNLIIASTDNTDFKLSVGEFLLNGVNPISDFSIFIENTQLIDVNITYLSQTYKIANINAVGLKFDYQPHFENIFLVQNIADKIKVFHQEIDYESISFQDFVLTDDANNVSRVADGSYSKQALVDDLPSKWNAHLTGLEISPSHLPPQYAQLLRDYQLKDLNGILDISFDYQTESRTAVFAINNMNFGGMANLQSDILVSMTDERFNSLYDLDNFDKNLNTLPIEHAELLYSDHGLYNHFVVQLAPKMQLTEANLRTQIRFTVALSSAQLTNLDRRLALTQPFLSFIEKPAGLRMEFSPAKPVRFQQYLNVYDANILVRDLNPSIQYISE